MTRRRQIAVVASAAGWCAAVALLGHLLPGSAMWDAAQLYYGGRALLLGRDPYASIQEHFPYPLLYPLPAVVLFAPLAVLPPLAARVVWAALQGAAFGLAGTRNPPLLVGLLSAGFLEAVLLGQWSPFLAAAAVLPFLGVVWAAKPTLGVALFTAYPSRAALSTGALLLLVATLIMPSWPTRWAEVAQQQIYKPPILRPGGILLWLGLFQWRLREGRLLVALSLVPQTTSMYETVILFLLANERREAYGLAGLSLGAALLNPWLGPWHQQQGQSLSDHLDARWPLTLLFFYLPAVAIVLRRSVSVRREVGALSPEPKASGHAWLSAHR
jgi:hypothetical protein